MTPEIVSRKSAAFRPRVAKLVSFAPNPHTRHPFLANRTDAHTGLPIGSVVLHHAELSGALARYGSSRLQEAK